MIDFNGSQLYISLRSPFARRVRLAFLEHDIKYEEKILDVFDLPPYYLKINPVARVPALVLKTGESIIDSNAILAGFYERYKESPLKPKTDRELVASMKWTGIALGLCEALVENFLETKKPKEKQSDDVYSEKKSMIENSLREFEHFIEMKLFVADESLTQADLDMGTALAYLGLRYDSAWGQKYPKTWIYFERLNKRPSFQKTIPPN